ncbi:hypothetical protein EJ03DRAFT_89660 [Teratosphaeria nubilosa]|uniref:Uncharacterized protein n=1 Tax=Teratosphaeria nubilosa TaxID=161662 RepID=A0A6G1L9S8_9PEZI|nr:hypothetical protein EJ03DRAFT_89660 [Teratosphaeria nubilosa]
MDSCNITVILCRLAFGRRRQYWPCEQLKTRRLQYRHRATSSCNYLVMKVCCCYVSLGRGCSWCTLRSRSSARSQPPVAICICWSPLCGRTWSAFVCEAPRNTQLSASQMASSDRDAQAKLAADLASLTLKPKTAAEARPARNEPATPAAFLLSHCGESGDDKRWPDNLRQLVAELQQEREQPRPPQPSIISVGGSSGATTKPAASSRRVVHYVARRRRNTRPRAI